MFGSIGPWEIMIILLIALIVVGPGKLPDVARSIGKGLNEFKRVTTGVRKEFEDVMKDDIKPSTSSAAKKNDADDSLGTISIVEKNQGEDIISDGLEENTQKNLDDKSTI